MNLEHNLNDVVTSLAKKLAEAERMSSSFEAVAAAKEEKIKELEDKIKELQEVKE
ncbi:hypothetical protein [Oceanobacillus neutriphilus]|uniref:Phage major capsid protein n=1 Tax=Oceanobacillus neutriphilus TaxID=531815 RepID=A0ABQ2NQK9_9BACI|nr:hypothetical protein [Oceanobacillus neutriphilus]GGP07261.1 hypothetical protein GCM10011346_02540 [Oceanobacillus neutriphilus]